MPTYSVAPPAQQRLPGVLFFAPDSGYWFRVDVKDGLRLRHRLAGFAIGLVDGDHSFLRCVGDGDALGHDLDRLPSVFEGYRIPLAVLHIAVQGCPLRHEVVPKKSCLEVPAPFFVVTVSASSPAFRRIVPSGVWMSFAARMSKVAVLRSMWQCRRRTCLSCRRA